ncbi:hypothetical protein [Flavobacterium reichenbachii]|uniref:Uncharacterized protein n=1 Tax=Flavobacterium reichenbachii TaxID=362418 RepID=A0A085ZN21_9FLAO|nr:hypothetical protein [Flavobacterium reichenbachii]KFF05835.1 hypothetical protein IW19_10005 [Flavobacterium reichenbachii]OXB12720.1 hypothetical protein B0A68_18200 [Flavobacterium reichenbachii]
MGFNFTGIVVNKNYEDDINVLAKDLGLGNLKYEEEIEFSEAHHYVSKNTRHCVVYPAENGTLIFLCQPLLNIERIAKNEEVLSFLISEYSMTFFFEYYKKDRSVINLNNSNSVFECVRSKILITDNEIAEYGDKLPIESSNNLDTMDTIFHLISEVLGQEFGSIDMNCKIKTYYMSSDNSDDEAWEPKLELPYEFEVGWPNYPIILQRNNQSIKFEIETTYDLKILFKFTGKALHCFLNALMETFNINIKNTIPEDMQEKIFALPILDFYRTEGVSWKVFSDNPQNYFEFYVTRYNFHDKLIIYSDKEYYQNIINYFNVF